MKFLKKATSGGLLIATENQGTATEGGRLVSSYSSPRRGAASTTPVSLFCFVSTLLLVAAPLQQLQLVPSSPLFAQAQQQFVNPNMLQAPTFTRSMDSWNVRENTPVNEIVYTLEARTESSGLVQDVKIIYDIEDTQLFSLVDRFSGQVRVAQPIDREQTGDSVTFQVAATPYLMNRAGTPTRLRITVYILDENDNAPKIERVKVGVKEYDSSALARQAHSKPGGQEHSPLGALRSQPPVIRANVSEDAPVESVLVDLIEAIDVDKASSSPLSALCLNCEPEFRLAPKTSNSLNDRLDWSIVLVKQLVHVPRNNVRQLDVIVSDGKFNSSIVFEITIDDVQNRPPHFISSTTCVVQENTPLDRIILTIQAVDGDALAMDDAAGPLLLQSPTSNKTTSNQYRGRQIIYDFYDQATDISSSQHGNFKLHPLTGQLQVANRLDREDYLDQATSGVLFLQVRARELFVDAETVAVVGDDLYESILNKLANFIDRSENSITVTEVSVIVVDVNDNSPRWLNATEIQRMNQAQVWHQSLPRDRQDTGRNYHIRVRENTPPGSPLTSKSEMFVYDLDNSDNAEFNITLEDPFHLFDVEPKRVSGFSSVTLKLAANVGNQVAKRQLLDYENISARSYIIQLYAEETRTQERFKSKAQIQIDVLDVNDNAPEFKEPAYMANIREDAPPGKTVKLVSATDRDSVSKHLKYSLHGQSSYLFDINPLSGLITVAKCEQSIASSQPMAGSNSRRVFTVANQQHHNPRPCIDFELQQRHDMMVEVSDGELSSKVPLVIFIEDALDNAPVFTLPIVDVVIEEGAKRLEPPIKIEATDVDQTSTLSYSIVEGNFEGFFAMNNVTGELQLTRAIRIPHDDLSSSATQPQQLDLASARRQQQLNKMTLIVQASDGIHSANGTIRIDILDANDNAPQFSRMSYEKEISETAPPGQSVLTVRAFDLDRGNNARVSYRIERGSFNQFEINEATGEISVAQHSKTFDVTKKDNYTMEVVAFDHGLVSKSSSVLVLIKVVGASRRAPEFSPQVQRKTINENTLNNTIIHRMTVLEPQQQQQQQFHSLNQMALMFEPGPIEGLDKFGQPVSELERLESMFSVSTNTGDVVVNSGLDHDFASHINLTIYVSYRPLAPPLYDPNFGPANLTELTGNQQPQMEEFRPRSVGYFIINVMDDNDHAPIFAAPWTPQQPELSYQMLEELPVGSILTQLVASDADSKISHFEIEPPNEYFELTSPQSGVIVNKKVIDYDTLMRQTFLSPGHAHRGSPSAALMQQIGTNNMIQFNVVAYDSGLRQLSAKAIVSVEILPINDNDCKFEHQLYEVHLRENALPDTVVTQVRANDLDFGEQHSSVSYQLVGDLRDLFNIDPRTGVVTVSQRGSIGLDREQLQHPVISLTVVGRDDQQQPSGAALQESNPRANSRVRPQQQASLPLLSGRSCSATVKIHVDDVNDNPPLFAQKVYDVIAYDTDVLNVPLVKLIVHDEDTKHNINNTTVSTRSVASANSFRILSGNLNDSFNITPSGMIYVTKPLNETRKASQNNNEPIQLRVQVKQQSNTGPIHPSVVGNPNNIPTLFTDECLVRVRVMKINRYAPEWRFEPAMKGASIEENKPPGTLVTQLKCADRDYIEPKLSSRFDSTASAGPRRPTNSQPSVASSESQPATSPIRYWIKENGMNVLETNEFRLDSVTGSLITRVELDREKRALYQLVVSCEDNGRPQSLESITSLYVTVLDVDDNKPEFLVPRSQQLSQSTTSSVTVATSSKASSAAQQPQIKAISFMVEEQQSKGLQVGELKAVDRDLDARFPINYCLLEGNEYQEFLLDQVTGILYTNQTLDRERQAAYDLLVRALNDGQTCEEYLASSQPTTTGNLTTTPSPAIFRSRGPSGAHEPTASATNSQTLHDKSLIRVRVELQDINDNAPVFRRSTFRAGVHHRSLLGTLVTQVAALDPDHEANGTLNYRISEILFYKTNPLNSNDRQRSSEQQQHHHHYQQQSTSKPIKLIQSPFKIDQQGNIYTQQLLTQYQLMSMFVLHIEATEMAEPWRTAVTKLEVYLYETNSQLKIRINLHPRFIEAHRFEVESLLSNATKYTAIINRARSYNGNAVDSQLLQRPNSKTAPPPPGVPSKVPSIDLSSQDPISDQSEPNFSNIHAIFVENHRLVSPNLVMDKFDLTSAQLLFTQQSLSQQLDSRQNSSLNEPSPNSNEVSSLIDKIALASIQSAEFHATPSSLAGIDWLESPSVLFVCLSSMLTLIGLLICLMGCCCTSRIKDHIIKTAMDKLVKQQTLQAKINERVLAATNQAYANSALGGAVGGQSLHHQSLQNMNGHDFIMQQGGGLMSSFDATKGCLTNNYENMSILQRAMEAGEFIDPNYTALTNNGHLNLGAHYYDAGEQLDGTSNQLQGDDAGEQHYQVAGKQCQLNGGAVDNSIVSLSLEDEEEDDDDDDQQGIMMVSRNNHELTTGDLMGKKKANGQLMGKAPTKLYTNGANGVVSSHSRIRQQIPNNSHGQQ